MEVGDGLNYSPKYCEVEKYVMCFYSFSPQRTGGL